MNRNLGRLKSIITSAREKLNNAEKFCSVLLPFLHANKIQ